MAATGGVTTWIDSALALSYRKVGKCMELDNKAVAGDWKGRNRNQYFNNWVFFFFPMSFLWGWGMRIHQRVIFSALCENHRTFSAISMEIGVRWVVMVPSSCWEISLRMASLNSRPWTRRGRTPAVLLTYLSASYNVALMKKLHCARPIPGHGYDHTLAHQGVSIAGFHILFKQWFLCVYCWKKKKTG